MTIVPEWVYGALVLIGMAIIAMFCATILLVSLLLATFILLAA